MSQMTRFAEQKCGTLLKWLLSQPGEGPETLDMTRYLGPRWGSRLNRLLALSEPFPGRAQGERATLDMTRFLGQRIGTAVNRLLDDSVSDHLGITLDTPLTRLLATLVAVAAVVGCYRLLFGIGAASNLNDQWPWGLWIAFDVLGGVAMAAGAFMIAGAVYILNWKKYKCIARAAILNAFFGYLLAAISITLDVGRSFVIWHPLVMWQINSIMFIVALHLVLYLSTLATESSPMVLEKLGWQRGLDAVHRIMIGAVMFGVALSLLHQSSLGANYLIVPGKLSPLWYNKNVPYLFLNSALMMGCSMVSFETILTGKVFKHKVPFDVVLGLARGILVTGTFYLCFKLFELARGPGLAAPFDGSLEGVMWLIEMGVGVVLPLLLLALPGVRRSRDKLFVVDILVIFGVLFNRLNVCIFGVARYNTAFGGDYFPSAMEWILTIGMIAFAVLGFKLCAKYLNLFPDHGHH